MPIPFSRSTRALYATNFRLSLIWLGGAMGLASLWLAWFFLASVPVYQEVSTTTIRTDGLVVATVSDEEATDIQVGQTAQVYLSQPDGGQVIVPAVVISLTPSRAKNGMQVELYVQGKTIPHNPLRNGQQRRIDIAIAHVSPATLVWQNAVSKGN